MYLNFFECPSLGLDIYFSARVQVSSNFFQSQSSDVMNLYQRQCSNVFKFNTEAHESLIFFQSNTSVVFPEKELIFNKDFLQAGIYYILIFYKLVILFFIFLLLPNIVISCFIHISINFTELEFFSLQISFKFLSYSCILFLTRINFVFLFQSGCQFYFHFQLKLIFF